jgi:hypothetical protein
VVPGDVVVSPDTWFYRYQEFMDRDEDTRCVVTKFNPLLVLARIDGSVDGRKLPPGCSTFVVLSITRGFLVTVMSRENQRDGRGG